MNKEPITMRDDTTTAAKLPYTKPGMHVLSSKETEAKVSSPGENGIVTGPS